MNAASVIDLICYSWKKCLDYQGEGQNRPGWYVL